MSIQQIWSLQVYQQLSFPPFDLKTICEEDKCEIQSCNKRHPKSCRFYEMFQRCKFGEYCSFKHVETAVKDVDEKCLEEIKDQLMKLEEKIDQRDLEIKRLEVENKSLENKVSTLEKEFKLAMEKLIEKSTQALTDVATKMQSDADRRNEAILKEFKECVTTLSQSSVALNRNRKVQPVLQSPQSQPCLLHSQNSKPLLELPPDLLPLPGSQPNLPLPNRKKSMKPHCRS